MLIVAVCLRYFRRNLKEILRLRAKSPRLSTAFRRLLPKLLRNNLPCGVADQFLLAFLERCSLYNAFHHIIDAVYAEPLLHVPHIYFWVFDYGAVSTFIS